MCSVNVCEIIHLCNINKFAHKYVQYSHINLLQACVQYTKSVRRNKSVTRICHFFSHPLCPSGGSLGSSPRLGGLEIRHCFRKPLVVLSLHTRVLLRAIRKIQTKPCTVITAPGPWLTFGPLSCRCSQQVSPHQSVCGTLGSRYQTIVIDTCFREKVASRF